MFRLKMLKLLLLVFFEATCNVLPYSHPYDYSTHNPYYSNSEYGYPNQPREDNWADGVMTHPVPPYIGRPISVYSARSVAQPYMPSGITPSLPYPNYYPYERGYDFAYYPQTYNNYPYYSDTPVVNPSEYLHGQPIIQPRLYAFNQPVEFPYDPHDSIQYSETPQYQYKPSWTYPYHNQPYHPYGPQANTYRQPMEYLYVIHYPYQSGVAPSYPTNQYPAYPNGQPHPDRKIRARISSPDPGPAAPPLKETVTAAPSPTAAKPKKKPTVVTTSDHFSDDIYGKPTNPLDDKIRAKTAYIAALIDREHLDFQEFAESEWQFSGDYLTEDQARKKVAEHLEKTLNKAMEEIKKLKALTKDKAKSAKEVAKHFAKDHIKPLLDKCVDRDNPPVWVDKLAQQLTKKPRKKIKLIFGVK